MIYFVKKYIKNMNYLVKKYLFSYIIHLLINNNFIYIYVYLYIIIIVLFHTGIITGVLLYNTLWRPVPCLVS